MLKINRKSMMAVWITGVLSALSGSEVFALDGTPGTWAACQGDGGSVCTDMVSASDPTYWVQHPSCRPNAGCTPGTHFTCNSACGAPTTQKLATRAPYTAKASVGCVKTTKYPKGVIFKFDGKTVLKTSCSGITISADSMDRMTTPGLIAFHTTALTDANGLATLNVPANARQMKFRALKFVGGKLTVVSTNK